MLLKKNHENDPYIHCQPELSHIEMKQQNPKNREKRQEKTHSQLEPPERSILTVTSLDSIHSGQIRYHQNLSYVYYMVVYYQKIRSWYIIWIIISPLTFFLKTSLKNLTKTYIIPFLIAPIRLFKKYKHDINSLCKLS